jgi:very-short-patch-repair endonuclease
MKNIQRARALRKNQTDAEKLLWKHIRNRQLSGYKFRRQYPIGNYIVDFVCLSLKLVIELDGSQHMNNTDYDDQRTQFLTMQGYTVVHFWNNELLHQTDSVLEAHTLTLARREREN